MAMIVIGALGCGNDDAREPVTDAAEKTIEAGPSRVTVRFRARESGEREQVSTARGFQDSTRDRSLLDKGEDRRIHDRGVLYVMPLYKLPPGKRWLSLDYRLVGSGGPRGPLGVFDKPADSLRHARAIQSVKRVDTEMVRGVECTHYRGTVPIDDVPNELPAGRRANARVEVDKLAKLLAGDDMITVDAWVDDDNLVRRVHETWVIDPRRGKRQTAEMSIEFYDFGSTVAIEPPAASEVLRVDSDEAKAFFERAGRERARRQKSRQG
jgi:hypothetical protein